MGLPTLILVTGPAGSGKTTLAHELARTVGCPVISRDEIKEGMVASSPGFVATPSDPLTMRTFELFFAVLGMLLEAEVTVVAEAAFQHRLWLRGLEPMSGRATLRVVRCQVPDALARERQTARAALPTRAAHADAAHLEAAAPFEPLSLDVPTLDVHTANGYHPTLAEIAAFCRG